MGNQKTGVTRFIEIFDLLWWSEIEPTVSPRCGKLPVLRNKLTFEKEYVIMIMTCLLRNLYAGQEATVRTGHGTMDWIQIGKGACQGYILSPSYLTYIPSTSCKMLGLMKDKLESRLPEKYQ